MLGKSPVALGAVVVLSLGMGQACHDGQALLADGRAVPSLPLGTEDGSAVSSASVTASTNRIFFTCCCGPCLSAARAMENSSADAVLVSYKPWVEIHSFIRKSGWRGDAVQDLGARFQLRCGETSCPALLVQVNGR